MEIYFNLIGFNSSKLSCYCVIGSAAKQSVFGEIASSFLLIMTTFCNTVIIYDLKTVNKVGFVIASVAKQSKTKEIASGGTLAMTLILSFSAIYYLLHVIKHGMQKEWGFVKRVLIPPKP